MKISVDDNNSLLLEEVYNGITLKSSSGEKFSICMRDTGFEFNYNGKWYCAKEGQVKEIKNLTNKKNN